MDAMKDMSPFHPPIKRGESADSHASRDSASSTADLSSFGESSMSSLVSTSRLYGREREEEILKSSFDRIVRQRAPCKPNLVLISGGCGTGKTRLSESLRSHVADAGGFFCSGKFDQHQDDPFAPMCASLNSYVQQLLQTDEETIRAARRRIRAAVEKDLYSLANIFPSLQLLMKDDLRNAEFVAKKCEKCEKCNQKQGRSMFAFHKLMRAICTPERPIVMVLDDIQWATRCPLQKWRAMINDDMNEGIMFLGISRDDVPPTSELSIFLRDLECKDNVDITNVSVQNLQQTHVEEMINEIFLMPPAQSQSLATFVFKHSAGNAYFVVESLRMLQFDSGMLKYDTKSKTWEVNHDICDQMMDYCPRSFMEQKLRTIPRDIQKVFMAASCLGSNITERLLEVTLQESVGERFQNLVERGKFVYNEARKTYSFRHNAFQSACYDLITEELQPAFHLEIGLRLWRYLDEEELDDNLYLVLNQLKQGAALMRDQKMRYEVAAMCIRAAEKAAAVYSFPTASSYLRFAFVLLGPKHWEEAYDLSLVLHNYAAEVEFAQGDSDRVDFLIEEVIANAKEVEDKIRACWTQIYVLGVRGKANEAIDMGICCLKMLGVNITPQCHQLNLAWASARIARKLRGKSDPMIKRLPHMKDSKKLAAMQILNMLFLNTFLARKELFPFVVLKMMKLTLVDGMSAISSVAFAGYGALLCFAGQVDEGLRFGKLALELVEEWNAHSFQSRVGAFVWGSIFVHVRPFTESLNKLNEGHRLGLQTGDTEFAMLNAHLHTVFMIDSGKYTMSTMINQYNEFKDLTALHGHPKQLDVLNPFITAMKTFADPNGNLADHSELDEGLAAAQKSKNNWALEIVYNTKHFFYFTVGDYKSAIEMIDSRESHHNEGSIHEAFGLYVDGLTYFAEARRTSNSQQAKKLLKKARNCLRLLKRLAKSNPTVALGKLVLLEAENAALMNRERLAEEKYNHAASLAAKYGSHFELAFAKQAAGEHFALDLNDKARAIECFEDACEEYEAWEGRAAVTHLKQKISQLKNASN